MRLAAVAVLGLITVYWAGYALVLLFLPEEGLIAQAAVLIGAVFLLIAAVYAVITWGVFKRGRVRHVVAIVVAALGALQPALGQLNPAVWALCVANVAAVVLLVLTIPRGSVAEHS